MATIDQSFFELNPQYPDWPQELQTEVEETLGLLDSELESEDPVTDGDTPSGDVYCGCPTCVVREILTIAVARTVQAVQEGKLRVDGVTQITQADAADF